MYVNFPTESEEGGNRRIFERPSVNVSISSTSTELIERATADGLDIITLYASASSLRV